MGVDHSDAHNITKIPPLHTGRMFAGWEITNSLIFLDLQYILCLAECDTLHVITGAELHHLLHNQEEDTLAPQLIPERTKTPLCCQHPHCYCHGLCKLSLYQDRHQLYRACGCVARWPLKARCFLGSQHEHSCLCLSSTHHHKLLKQLCYLLL